MLDPCCKAAATCLTVCWHAQVAVIRVINKNNPKFVVAFRGSEPFVQVCVMGQHLFLIYVRG